MALITLKRLSRKGNRCYTCSEEMKKDEVAVKIRAWNLSRLYHPQCLVNYINEAVNGIEKDGVITSQQ